MDDPGDHTGFDTCGTPTIRQAGWLGKLYDEPADPGTISFVPRPDWYFYFLFYLLRIFKWPESVILGTIGIPTIALMLLIALPFIDLRAERRPLHRPVAMVAACSSILSMGVLTWKGATAKESLGSENLSMCRRGRRSRASRRTRGDGGRDALRRQSAASTATPISAPAVTTSARPTSATKGAKNKGVAFQIAHLKCPSCVKPGQPDAPLRRARGPRTCRRSPRSSRRRRAASSASLRVGSLRGVCP